MHVAKHMVSNMVMGIAHAYDAELYPFPPVTIKAYACITCIYRVCRQRNSNTEFFMVSLFCKQKNSTRKKFIRNIFMVGDEHGEDMLLGLLRIRNPILPHKNIHLSCPHGHAPGPTKTPKTGVLRIPQNSQKRVEMAVFMGSQACHSHPVFADIQTWPQKLGPGRSHF